MIRSIRPTIQPAARRVPTANTREVVAYGKAPLWLYYRLLRVIGPGHGNDRTLDNLLARAGRAITGTPGCRLSCLSHWGRSVVDGREVFTAQPYSLGPVALSHLVAFTARLDLTYEISGVATWCPGRTLRIDMWPREQQEGAGS